MRICLIANPNSPHIHRWAKFFLQRRHEVHLIGSQIVRRHPPDGVIFHDPTHWPRVRKLRYLIWASVVRQIIHQIQPDLIHAHGVSGGGWLGAASGFHPLIITSHGSDLLLLDRRSILHRKLSFWALRNADYLTCVSEELAQKARQVGIPDQKVEVADLGVDTEIFQPAKSSRELCASLNLNSGPVVMSIRSLKSVYNPLVFAEAIPLILNKIPTAQFLVSMYNADSDMLLRFKHRLGELGVTKAVHFIGELNDDRVIADHYRLADVAVSIPTSDGTPKSVQEAMACGVALVLSDLPSLREWVQNEREALIIPQVNAKALSRAVVRLLYFPQLRESLGREGNETVRCLFSQETCLQRYEEIYLSLSSRRESSYPEVEG